MRIKVNSSDDVYKIEDILTKMYPNNIKFDGLAGKLNNAVRNWASEHGFDIYFDTYIKYYYPIHIVFTDKQYNETDLENAVNWYWDDKRESEGHQAMSYEMFLKKYGEC